MINPRCFSNEWILAKKEEIGAVQRHTLEKSIYALALLTHLSESGLEFIFKGGTSLLLHLSPIKRLSIDIDIICTEPAEKLEQTLGKIGALAPFNKMVEDERGHRGLPNRRHFQFHYKQLPRGNPFPLVLLDVIEESECKLPLEQKTIITDFIEVEKEVNVIVPTIDGLLGDKLTAFAPNTIGVPFISRRGEPQETDVAKQLFDVGELFNNIKNIKDVEGAYRASFENESRYQGNKHSFEEALNDTYSTCYNFCGQRLKRFTISEDAQKLEKGASGLQNHLVNCKFHKDFESKTAAAKAAMLSRIIQKGKTDINLSEIIYDELKQGEIASVQLSGDYSPLSRLKLTNPEAFYYWFTTQRLFGD